MPNNYKDFLPSLCRTFPFGLHGPLETCPRTPWGSVDPGLRTPALYHHSEHIIYLIFQLSQRKTTETLTGIMRLLRFPFGNVKIVLP